LRQISQKRAIYCPQASVL